MSRKIGRDCRAKSLVYKKKFTSDTYLYFQSKQNLRWKPSCLIVTHLNILTYYSLSHRTKICPHMSHINLFSQIYRKTRASKKLNCDWKKKWQLIIVWGHYLMRRKENLHLLLGGGVLECTSPRLFNLLSKELIDVIAHVDPLKYICTYDVCG